jgi:hypothetical protein
MADRIALYTTVYPAAARYLAAWWRSVAAQTDCAFELWIGVDGMRRDEVAAAMGAEPCAEWVFAEHGDSPAAIRARAMARMVERHDGVVFADCDDILHPERVAASREALRGADVTACALRIIDEESRDLGLVFGPSPEDDPVERLPWWNVFGLSNSVYRASVLRRCLPAPAECVAVDWLLATRALAAGATLAWERTPLMQYRQYPANVARVLPPFSESDVLAATRRVLLHYDCALESDGEGGGGRHVLPDELRAALTGARERARRFHSALVVSPERRARYVAHLNALPPRYVWWWCVAHPALEDLWRR